MRIPPGHCFMEYLEEDGKWRLSLVPIDLAQYAVKTWPDAFNFADVEIYSN